MAIYVQSRSELQEKDYRWQKVRQNKFIFEVPPLLKIISVGELIQSQKYSIVLARKDGQLVLLVTGLFSERTDFMNRPIRNSVAWVEEDSPENEQIIRSLAVLALRDKQTLENKVNEAVLNIGATSDYHFEVDREKINQLSELIQVQSNNKFKEDNYIGNSSAELQEEVGLELQSNCLPNRDGVLVLVTTLKTESNLKKYKIWRALSGQVPYQQLIRTSSGYINPARKKKERLQIALKVAVVLLIVVTAIIIIQKPVK